MWRQCYGYLRCAKYSVGGLQAQSFALQNISGNIANASTVGYKGIETNFEDLIPDATTPSRQVAGGVTAFAQATISTQGTVSHRRSRPTWRSTGMASFRAGGHRHGRQRAGVQRHHRLYPPRRFQVNANGNLVNGAGYYLMGVAVDPKTGNPTGNVPQVLPVSRTILFPHRPPARFSMPRIFRPRRRPRQAAPRVPAR